MSNYPGNYSQNSYNQGAYGGYAQGQTGMNYSIFSDLNTFPLNSNDGPVKLMFSIDGKFKGYSYSRSIWLKSSNVLVKYCTLLQ